jgi:hypothetical protein
MIEVSMTKCLWTKNIHLKNQKLSCKTGPVGKVGISGSEGNKWRVLRMGNKVDELHILVWKYNKEKCWFFLSKDKGDEREWRGWT